MVRQQARGIVSRCELYNYDRREKYVPRGCYLCAGIKRIGHLYGFFYRVRVIPQKLTRSHHLCRAVCDAAVFSACCTVRYAICSEEWF